MDEKRRSAIEAEKNEAKQEQEERSKEYAKGKSEDEEITVIDDRPQDKRYEELSLYQRNTRRNNHTYDTGLKTAHPTATGEVTSPYGNRVIDGKPEFHSGVDYRNRIDDSLPGASVHAVKDGVITQVGATKNGTNYLSVTDIDGILHGYYHTSTKLQPGTTVKAGQPIGNTDMSGRTTGPHLHYTVQTDPYDYYSRVNPEDWLEEQGATLVKY